MPGVKFVVKVRPLSPYSQEVRSIIPPDSHTTALPGDKAPSFPPADRGHGEAEINDQTAFVLR